ncbi:7428_t:CDS:1, partial [Paraglomus occultum]
PATRVIELVKGAEDKYNDYTQPTILLFCINMSLLIQKDLKEWGA